jgi:hypothetical protein
MESSLFDAIDTAARAMFPSRTATEALLDLGEHKAWTPDDRSVALADFVTFLVNQLGLPPDLASIPVEAPDLGRLRTRLWGGGADAETGVASWIAQVAPALGSAAKTLANSRPRTPDAGRPDHRWLFWLARTLDSSPSPEVCLYPTRTCSATAAWLGRWGADHVWDAADAMLLVSLVALWQRRRPVAEVRGQRGKPGSRRQAPKPVVRIAQTLCQLGQVHALVDLLIALHGAKHAAPWLAPVLESALNSAHLQMHPDRRGVAATNAAGLFRAIEAELHRIDGPACASLRWRIDRMRAWHHQRELTAPPTELADDGYVQWSFWLERRRRDLHARAPTHLPVPWMLEPQVTASGARG